MKKILISIFLITLFVKIEAQIYVHSGEVKGRWVFENSPYIVEGNITITDTLIIEPGVEVKFKDSVSMEVTGKLIAVGTSTDSIFFTNLSNTWRGIRIRNSNFMSILKYFQISGVRNLDYKGGALLIYKSNNVKISHGTFYNNSAEYQAGALSLSELNDFAVSNVLFYKNSLYSDYNGGWQGSAVAIENSFIKFTNITAVKNNCLSPTNYSAATFYFYFDSEVVFENCIIQGNDSNPFFSRNEDQIYISNSNIQGLSEIQNPIIGENNYDSVPAFIDFENDNFQLKWINYPDQDYKPKEVDGGVISIHDLDGSISDIGAFNFDQSGIYFPPSAFFSASSTYVNVGTEIQFINNTQKGSEEIKDYFWDFGDGNSSTEYEPSHIFNSYGRYTVSLTVTDINGNTDTKSKTNYIISGTLIPESTVSGVWNNNLSPYIISGDIIVPENELLEINEGVDVFFTGYYGITVDGDLILNGKENENVVFIALDTLFFYDRNIHWDYILQKDYQTGWKGIYYSGNNNKSYVNYSTFSYARSFIGNFEYDPNDTRKGAALAINFNDSFKIKNSSFFNNNANGHSNGILSGHKGAAIKSQNSNIEINNCYFKNNHADKSIVYLTQTSNSKVLGNYFTENERGEYAIYAAAGEKVNENYQLVIQDNTIINNKMGGIVCGAGLSNAKILVNNNRIEDNIGRGIYVGSGGTILVSNNWIVNNIAFDGGGISIRNQFVPTIVNNFISDNEITYIWGQGSGILCEMNALIINNTLTKNRAAEAIYGDNSTYTAINNILYDNPDGNFGQNSGAGVYPKAVLINNYEGNPRFVYGDSPKLVADSPCIDAGTLDLPVVLPSVDIFGDPRISGISSKIDIGAVEYREEALGVDDSITELDNLNIYPNPTANILNIKMPNNNIEKVILYEISGKILKEFNSNEINLLNFKTGIYFIRIFTKSNSIMNLKVIKN
ncbi:MAG TPA: hypothetical protein DCG75_11385 [Bacteroidales bacterium]|nr:hypothetical protein [Bacteroidales bacterium]